MKSSVIGLGEVGGALFKILKEKYDIQWFEKTSAPNYKAEIMHVCIPWSDKFIDTVVRYSDVQRPDIIVIHSSVEVGTTEKLSKLVDAKCFHSPIRGQHPKMEGGILNYVKYIGTDIEDAELCDKVCNYFAVCGISVKLIYGTKATELAKLLELSRYGTYIAFAKEQEQICKDFGVKYDVVVTDYENTRSDGLKRINQDHLIQPQLYPFENFVGGHCTVEDMEILLNQKEYPLLKQAYDIDRGTKIWGNCNIYKTARIGKGCSIGNGTEIGNNVVIGNNVRIGAMCFIPEGVTIEDNCFIAPSVCFSNDKHPPSKKECWGSILIKNGAVIGLGTIVLPGVVVGEGAMVGAGAVVTKNVPPHEKWYGVPAMPHGVRNE
jgi:UDP-2-acetamido-3-amino-2,3-dideoxy-glucuronate N-acetyltransferase